MKQKLTLKEEQKLITASKQDLRKFSEVYNSFVDNIYGYSYVTLGNKTEAEDVTSQTFLSALEKIKDFEWRGISIKFWLLRIARNLIYKKYRKPAETSFDEGIEAKHLDDVNVEEIVIEKEMKEKLRELVFKLDEVTREIISLRIWEDYKFSEIAELTGMKEVTVKSRFYRGVERLKQMLEDEQQIKADFVLILAGVGTLRSVGDFLPSGEFKLRLASKIADKTNLIFKATEMQKQSIQQSAVSGQQGDSGVGQTVATGAKSSKWLYWVLAGVAGVVLVGGGAGGYLWWKNKQDEEEQQQEEEEEENKEETEASTEDSGSENGEEGEEEGEVQEDSKPRITFLKGNGQNQDVMEIWTINVDGTGEANTGHRLKEESEMSFFHQSPDLKYVCFKDGSPTAGEEIYLYDVEKNTIEQVSNSYFRFTETYDGSWFISCVWSSESSKIAYRVSHHPNESEGMAPKQKDPPPLQYSDKMGVFVYDLETKNIERIFSDDQIGGKQDWLPDGDWAWSYSDELIYNSARYYYKMAPNNASNYSLIREKEGEVDTVIYEIVSMLANPSSLRISPDKTRIVFADKDGSLVIFKVSNVKDLERYTSARVDGYWSKYEWLSDSEILFWQSRGGHDFNNDNGDWYQGNLLILNINSAQTRNLTNDNRTFWRM